VERGVALFEKQARIPKVKNPASRLAQLLRDPKRGPLFKELMDAIRESSFASLTPEQRRARASEGGKARAKKLTQEQRAAIGQAGAAERWGKKSPK